MAILHRAEIRPTKLELLAAWLPTQPWYPGPTDAELSQVGAFRFDDPAGEVGVETILVRPGDGPVVQVPLTYRGAPLADAEQWLVGTMEHSVLGPRWVYDGLGDPVYVAALTAALFAGADQAELLLEADGERVRREPSVALTGGGTPGSEAPAGVELTLRRVLDPAATPVGEHTLTATWAGQDEPVLLATASVSPDEP